MAKKQTIGIIGAGTMGAGIALAALYKGYKVVLQDAFPGAIENAEGYIKKFLDKKDLGDNFKKLTLTEKLEDVAGSDVVIEAIIEDLEIKQELFAKLDELCPPPAILASNTSTLAVTAIASATKTPERVVGMHFFNPAPVLPLVEVVRTAQTSEEVIKKVVKLAEDLGKSPVVTGDTPGFIVNRVARPFYGEALRLMGEGILDYEMIDKVLTDGAGFRMGPFQLMDLIGIDINAGAMKSMYEQTFGEPRYKPHWIQMQKVQAGTLGRKTGSGFYDYSEKKKEKKDKLPKRKGKGLLIFTKGSWAPGVRDLCEEKGFETGKVLKPADKGLACFIIAGRDEGLEERVRLYDATLPPELPFFVQTGDVTATEIAAWITNPSRIVGFDGLFLKDSKYAVLSATKVTSAAAKETAEMVFSKMGKIRVWVDDTPGMVLPRVICMLINEAAFAVQDGVGEAETIDKAMQLGVNYPKGLLAWGAELGFRRVAGVLEHMQKEYGEDRYRPCYLIKKWGLEEMMVKGTA